MRKSRYVITGVMVLGMLHAYSGVPDEWNGSGGNAFIRNWSLGLLLGATSYYGDLSQYDPFYVQKLLHESKPAIGLKLTKQFHPIVGLSGQLIYGGFKSDYRPEQAFETRLLEYNLQANLDIFHLIMPKRFLNYGLEFFFGVGQFIFQTSLYVNADGIQQPAPFKNSTPEFVYFFGGGLYYNISEKFRFTSDLSIRQAQNDNIDKYITNGDFDYYSMLTVGIAYAINSTFTLKKYRARNRVNPHPPVWRK